MMVETGNVKRALGYVQALLKRPVTEMVGMMLVYGNPGLGKTRFGERLAYSNGFIYMRLEASMTVKDFITNLLNNLHYKFHIKDHAKKGNTNYLLQEIKILLDEHPNTVIVIDEIDYSFGNKKLLGTIRDIVDETISVMILIGMQNAYNELKKTNQHFFDRCGYIMKFESNSVNDVKKMSKEVCEQQLDEEVIKTIYQHTGGNFRKTIKLLHAAEQLGDNDKFKRELTKLKGAK